MKSFLLCSVLATLMFVVMADQDEMQKMMQVSKACLAEARVTEDEMKNFFMNGMKASDAKDNVKCHMKCVMEKQGHLKNGVYDESVAVKFLKQMPDLKDHQAEVEKAVHECKNERGTNDCDTAFKITMCFKENTAAIKQ